MTTPVSAPNDDVPREPEEPSKEERNDWSVDNEGTAGHPPEGVNGGEDTSASQAPENGSEDNSFTPAIDPESDEERAQRHDHEETDADIDTDGG